MSGLVQHPPSLCHPLPQAALYAHHQSIRPAPGSLAQGVSPAPCTHHLQHQACPLCPSPRASNLPLVSIAHGLVPVPNAHQLWPSDAIICAITQDVVLSHYAHHLWYQVPVVCGIKPPPSPAGGTDPVAWGAMLEDDRLTWPPSQVGCPPLLAPPENLRCQKNLHWVSAPHPVPAALVPQHLNFLSSGTRRRPRTRRRSR